MQAIATISGGSKQPKKRPDVLCVAGMQGAVLEAIQSRLPASNSTQPIPTPAVPEYPTYRHLAETGSMPMSAEAAVPSAMSESPAASTPGVEEPRLLESGTDESLRPSKFLEGSADAAGAADSSEHADDGGIAERRSQMSSSDGTPSESSASSRGAGLQNSGGEDANADEQGGAAVETTTETLEGVINHLERRSDASSPSARADPSRVVLDQSYSPDAFPAASPPPPPPLPPPLEGRSGVASSSKAKGTNLPWSSKFGNGGGAAASDSNAACHKTAPFDFEKDSIVHLQLPEVSA